jgi:hypothetical protein
VDASADPVIAMFASIAACLPSSRTTYDVFVRVAHEAASVMSVRNGVPRQDDSLRPIAIVRVHCGEMATSSPSPRIMLG